MENKATLANKKLYLQSYAFFNYQQNNIPQFWVLGKNLKGVMQ